MPTAASSSTTFPLQPIQIQRLFFNNPRNATSSPPGWISRLDDGTVTRLERMKILAISHPQDRTSGGKQSSTLPKVPVEYCFSRETGVRPIGKFPRPARVPQSNAPRHRSEEHTSE